MSCAGLRADEFIEVGEQALEIGIYWISADRNRGDPFVFQLLTLEDGLVAHMQGYRRKAQALKAGSATP